jgi:hypothetical protein
MRPRLLLHLRHRLGRSPRLPTLRQARVRRRRLQPRWLPPPHSLDRNGYNRRQDIARRRGEDPDAEDEDDGEEADIDWEVLLHLTPAQRAMINNLENVAREDALDQLRIQLFEQQGIMFGQDAEPRGPSRFQTHPLIQQLLQQLLDTFVARAPADENGASELIQDIIAEVHPGLAAWAVQQIDGAFDAIENPGIEDEHMRTLAQHFTQNRDILALDMDPELLARLGTEVAEQLVQQAGRFEDEQDSDVEEAAEAADPPGIFHGTKPDFAPNLPAAQDGNEAPLLPDGRRMVPFTEAHIEEFLEPLRRADLAMEGDADFDVRVGAEASENEDTGPSTPQDRNLSGGEKGGTGNVRSPPGAWPEDDEELGKFTYVDDLPEV